MVEDILKKINKRKGDSSKFDNGHLLVVGGSEKYSGSPALNSLAAYRSGVDLVTTAAPERPSDIIAAYSPSLITVPLQGGFFSSKNYEKLTELSNDVDALVVGGGTGRRDETMKVVRKLIKNVDIPVVVDADAIHAVSGNRSVLKKGDVLTPHSHEFKVLTGKDATESSVVESAEELGCTFLLTGEEDIITDGEDVYRNSTGNEYMTVGGTGDILAGVVGSLLAQGFSSLEASRGAAWINGKAGELAYEEMGPGVIPDDILVKIPEVLKEI